MSSGRFGAFVRGFGLLILAAAVGAVLYVVTHTHAPAYWEAELHAADLHLEQGQYFPAFARADNARMAATLDTERLIALQRVGLIYERLGDLRSARTAYLQSIAAGEDTVDSERPLEYDLSINGFIAAARTLGELDVAESFARRQVLNAADTVKYREAQHQLACTYAASGRWVEAERILTGFMTDSPRDGELFFNLRNALTLSELRYGEGRYEESGNIASMVVDYLMPADTAVAHDPLFFEAVMCVVRAHMAVEPKNPALENILGLLGSFSGEGVKARPSNYRLMLLQAQLLSIQDENDRADSIINAVESAVLQQFSEKAPLMLEVNDAAARICGARLDWKGAVERIARNVEYWKRLETSAALELPARYMPLVRLARYQRFAKDSRESVTRAEAEQYREKFAPLLTPILTTPFRDPAREVNVP